MERIADAMNAAFPDAEVITELVEPDILAPVNAKDRHVVVTAYCDARGRNCHFHRSGLCGGSLASHN